MKQTLLALPVATSEGSRLLGDHLYYVILLSLLLTMIVLYVMWLRKTLIEKNKRLYVTKKYSSVVENMPVLYAREELIYNAEGQIVDFIYREVNPTFEKYILPRDEILGKKYSELNRGSGPELLSLYNSLNDKRELTFTFMLEKTKTFLTVTVMYSKTEGCIDVFCVDNTELALTQQELRSTNHKLAAALDVADITPWKWELNTGRFICDVDRYLFIMKEEASVYGNQITIPIDAYFSKILEEDKSQVETACRKLIDGEVSRVKEEYRVMPTKENPDHYEWVEVRAIVDERDKNGKPTSLVGSSLVITKRKMMEQALIQAKEKAEEANKLKSAFLANISHEIRTPLNAIVGFSGLLVSSNSAAEEDKQEYMRIIQDNNDLLLQLVHDIIDLSKIESGALDLDYDDVDVHELFIGLEDSSRMRNKNSAVRILYQPEMPECRMRTDKTRLIQVMANLIGNAMKFTAKGSITFGYRLHEDDSIYFYVTDTGCGIPEERIDDIFRHFVKLDNFVQGTGLGLTICRTIIEKMGGRIGANSRKDEGSTFWFTLPYKKVRTDLCGL